MPVTLQMVRQKKNNRFFLPYPAGGPAGFLQADRISSGSGSYSSYEDEKKRAYSDEDPLLKRSMPDGSVLSVFHDLFSLLLIIIGIRN